MRSFGRRKPEPESDLSADLAAAALREMAVARFDTGGRILDASTGFCDLLGYSQDALVGKTHESLLRPDADHTPDDRALWQSLMNGQSEGRDSFACLRQGGQVVWLGGTYIPTLDDGGKVHAVLLFARDVSRRVRDEVAAQNRLDALDRSQARVEFDVDGNIQKANRIFLETVGYTLKEVQGRHHSMFLTEADRTAPAYQQFWRDLRNKEFRAGEFRRLAKGGKEIWLQATYCPILDTLGNLTGFIKIASDITEAKFAALLSESRLRALDSSQAVIEFNADGTIRTANRNFLNCVGYPMEEIVGKHHSMFMPPDDAGTPEYAAFWDEMRRGQYHAGEFRRMGNGGREIWLQATYNPIADSNGKIFRVEKFANDITGTKTAIQAFQAAMSRLAANDLTVRMTSDVPAEFEALKQQFNASASALAAVIGGISDRAGRILADAAQIDSAADDLSKRTEKQAATLEETAAKLDQMAGSVRNAASSAEEAATTATSAEDRTNSGLETVRKAIDAMNEIAKSSELVSNITGVIDGLAFQTNLLALNAGVEAARAGDSGRGFAVVASEVRQLAQRSSEASQEIAGLIRATSTQVQGGVDLVGASGTALEQIARFVQEIRSKVANLASAAQEQSRGLDDINAAAGELDKVTQQNVAMFEETTASTQSLTREVEGLSESTRQFLLAEDEAADTAAWDDARRAAPRSA